MVQQSGFFLLVVGVVGAVVAAGIVRLREGCGGKS
jgi:hypothetical protein